MAHRAPDETTLDLLCGEWRIWQLTRGHRFSTDDMLTAWTAARARPDALRLLDLGAGIGSVGLMALFRLPAEATLVAIEAQEVSHGLCRRTVETNGLAERVTLRLGDLRDLAMVPEEEHGAYDLVTGSPPYIPPGRGIVSPHPQRAGARIELRGDVFDYCRTAARALARDGVFCFCHAAGDTRPLPAIADAGLTLLCRQDVVFRRGRPPTISLFTCARQGRRRDIEAVVVREPDGRWSEGYKVIRRQVGLD